jgi:hypothetical protein
MIYLEDLQKVKEQNEQIIQANNETIVKKQKENCELEAENRVFDKLIILEKSKCDKELCVENTEETVAETCEEIIGDSI